MRIVLSLFLLSPATEWTHEPDMNYDSESPMHGYAHGELKSRRYSCFLKLVTLCGQSSAPETLHRSSDQA